MQSKPRLQEDRESLQEVIDCLVKAYDLARELRGKMSKLVQYQIMFNILIPTLLIADLLLSSYVACLPKRHEIIIFPTFIVGSFITVSSMTLIGFALFLTAIFLVHPNPSVRLRNFLTVVAIIMHEIAVNGVRDLILLPWKGLGKVLKTVILGRHDNVEATDVFTPLRVSAAGLVMGVQIPIIILSTNIVLLAYNTTDLHKELSSLSLHDLHKELLSNFSQLSQMLESLNTPVDYYMLHRFILILASALLLTHVTLTTNVILRGISTVTKRFNNLLGNLSVVVRARKIEENPKKEHQKKVTENEEERERIEDLKERCIALFEEYKSRVNQSRIRGSSRVLVHRYNMFKAFAKEMKSVLVIEIRKNQKKKLKHSVQEKQSEDSPIDLLEYSVKVMERLYDLRGIKMKKQDRKKVFEDFFISYMLTLIMAFSLGTTPELIKGKEQKKNRKIIKSMIPLLALAEVLKVRVNVIDLCITTALAEPESK